MYDKLVDKLQKDVREMGYKDTAYVYVALHTSTIPCWSLIHDWKLRQSNNFMLYRYFLPCTNSMHTHTLQAYVQLARLERERAEREHEKEEAERKKKREQMQRVERMLEAAFDGDTQEINTILKEVRKERRRVHLK